MRRSWWTVRSRPAICVPDRLAAAQNAQIWAATVLVSIEPAVAPNGSGVSPGADRRSPVTERTPGGVWDMVYYLACLAWIVVFLTLALGHYRTARVLAAAAIVPGLAALLQAQLTGIMPAPFGPWIFWVLLDLAPVLALTAFHRDAPPLAPWPWLLALAGF
jgi:hypothetical protein